ncbi:MAG TPA: hypothetical protein ENI61_03320 [Ignavibacteria bacterium]|nr:hypothetical protein [Ignavibacteria bacterium]
MNKYKVNSGWLTVILLSVIPFILWIFAPKADVPFANFQNSLISFGEIFGLVGLVMFSITLILASRLKFLEPLFGGLNRIYEKHNILGQISFILLLFHPLLLLPRYASNIKETSSFLFFSGLWARNFGIIALWMMIILIILTLYLRPKYNLWKNIHKFFGVALFFGALHVYFIPGYVMNNPILKIYILIFAVAGIVAFLYRSVFARFVIKTYGYIVEDIKKMSDDIMEITLRPASKSVDFNAGQFIFISFEQEGFSSESHPFSISSSPSERYLKITVKKLGDYTADLYSRLRIGTFARVEGPFGMFSYARSKNSNQIWIAGGIGITPFISFIKDLTIKKIDYSVQLFYCVEDEHEAVYLDLLNSLSLKSNNKLKIIPFYFQEKGYINVNYLKNNIDNLSRKEIFICAPPRMIQELKTDFMESSISKSLIHSEEFNF